MKGPWRSPHSSGHGSHRFPHLSGLAATSAAKSFSPRTRGSVCFPADLADLHQDAVVGMEEVGAALALFSCVYCDSPGLEGVVPHGPSTPADLRPQSSLQRGPSSGTRSGPSLFLPAAVIVVWDPPNPSHLLTTSSFLRPPASALSRCPRFPVGSKHAPFTSSFKALHGPVNVRSFHLPSRPPTPIAPLIKILSILCV